MTRSVTNKSSLPLHRPVNRERRESDERLRQIIDGSHDAFVAMGEEGLIEEWNPRAERLFGWRRNEALGQRLSDLIVPARHRAAHERGLQHFLATGDGPVLRQPTEIDALHRDGHEMAVELTVLPLKEGDRYSFTAFIRDVSERKSHERELAMRAEQIRAQRDAIMRLAQADKSDFTSALAQTLAEDGATLKVERVSYWALDQDGQTLTCESLYSLSGNGLVAGAAGTQLSVEKYPSYFAAIARQQPVVADDARRDIATREFEHDYLIPNGITSMLDVAVWHQGRIAGVVCHEHVGAGRQWGPEEIDFASSIAIMVSLLLESSRRQELAEALRLSESRYRSVVDHAKEGIIVTQDAKVKFANPYAYQLVDFDPSKSYTKQSFDLIHPDDRPMVYENYQRRLRGEPVPEEYTYRVVAKNGDVRWLQTKSLLIEWEGKSATLSFLTEVTERKRLEDSLAQTLAEQKTILEGATAGIVFIALGRIRWINSILEQQQLGYGKGELIGAHSEATFRSYQDWSAFLHEAVPVVQQGKTFACEVWLKRRDGSVFPTSFSGRAIDHKNLDRGTIWVIQDITERKRLQDSVRRALSERETILEAAVVGITHLQGDQVRWINGALEQQMLGYGSGELVDSGVEPIYAERESFIRVSSEFPPVLKANKSYQTEVQLRRKDGSTFWARLLGRAIDPSELSRGSIWIVEDVTEERERAQQLAARAQRLELHRRVLLELAALDEGSVDAALVRILRTSGQTLEVERTVFWPFEEKHARLRHPLLYRLGEDAIRNEILELNIGESTRVNAMAGLLRGEPIVAHDVHRDPLLSKVVDRVLAPYGVRSLMAVPVWASGRIVGALTFADMAQLRQWSDDEVEFALSVAKTVSLALEASARYELTAALRSSEEKYRHVVENASEPIIVVAQGKFRYANRRALALAGQLSYEEFLETPFLEFFHPEEHERVMTNYRRRIQGAPAETNYIVRMSERIRGVEWAQINATSVEWDGETGVLVIFNDLTQQMRVEAEMRKALEKERELSDLKSRFVSMTSHEFRTPLATILSSTQLLEDYAERIPASERAELLSFIKQSVHRMTEMLDDVLLIGRADSGRLEFNPQPVDVAELCAQLVNTVRMGIGSTHRVEFDIQSQDGRSSPRVNIDEKLIRHILNNLMSNAIKYSAIGTLVKLNVAVGRRQVRFEVVDHGIGIAPEDRPLLFDTFHRGRNVGTTPGTGLGLAIVKRAVDMHGGSIQFSTVSGQGTTFVVSIPLEE